MFLYFSILFFFWHLTKDHFFSFLFSFKENKFFPSTDYNKLRVFHCWKCWGKRPALEKQIWVPLFRIQENNYAAKRNSLPDLWLILHMNQLLMRRCFHKQHFFLQYVGRAGHIGPKLLHFFETLLWGFFSNKISWTSATLEFFFFGIYYGWKGQPGCMALVIVARCGPPPCYLFDMPL